VVGITKKTVSVRLPYTLYDKLSNDRNTNTYVVTKALQQYYRGKEPNQKVFTDCNTNVYDPDLIKLYQDQVQDLKLTNSQLLDMVQEKDRIIAVQSLGVFGRLKYLLQSKNE
jgi:hypothetical protein